MAINAKSTMQRVCAAIAASLLCAANAHAATAQGEWTTSTWSTLTASPDAISRPKYIAAGSPYTDFIFCDGYANTSAAGNLGNGRVLAWEFPRKATLTGVKLYSNHKDTGRDDIRLASVQVKYTADGAWETLANSAVTHNHTSTMQKKLFAGFAAPDGYNLAEDVVAVRLVFAANQENSCITLAEAELLGSIEPPSEPEEPSPYVWTAGGYVPGSWTPLVAESNMMAYCTSIQKDGTATSAYDEMIDQSVAQLNNALVGNGNTMAWLFDMPFDLYEFRVFSRWTDSGRDDIAIWKFETRDANGVWTIRTDAENYAMVGVGTSIDTGTARTGSNYAFLRRNDGEPIATGVTGIRVFPYNMGNAACWAEVEAEGVMPAGPAIFDTRSVTVANNCFKVDWTAQLASLGASDTATVNLWTSTNGVDYSLADSALVTQTGVDYAFTKTFDAVGLTISYRFETINTSGSSSWCSTNEVATFVNNDNSTYYWRPSVAAGSWEDAASWSNSLNDARLPYPSQQYATASFILLDQTESVEATVGASHTVRFVPPPSAATLMTLKGDSSVTLQFASLTGPLVGTNVLDGLVVRYPGRPTLAAGARIKARNGAKCYILPANDCGQYAGIELYSGAKLNIVTATAANDTQYFAADFEIVLDGGSVESAGYFVWSGGGYGRANRGHIVFRPGGGQFLAPGSHTLQNSGALCEMRYELPGGDWRGYAAAPLQPGDVNGEHQFGRVKGSGTFFVNVVFGEDKPWRAAEMPLIRKTNTRGIVTNNFAFAAFGTNLTANEPNSKGDYFYWTYGTDDTLEPANAGDLPSGLGFHYAGRAVGTVILLR